MYQITDLKPGVTFEMDKDVYQVIYSEHSKQARGGAIMRTKIKNLMTGAIIDKTFKGSEKMEPARLLKKDCQYLYKDEVGLYFMDSETYDQFTLNLEQVKDAIPFIKEGNQVQIIFYEKMPLSIDLPPKVNLKVAEAHEGIKGNSASASTKPIRLETGHVLQAPLFIKQGDTVRVNTTTGEYVERI
ncbi:MAG: elongation factor P [Patescibacteria group bacterium]|nr:elongation factor P [Patescibacteria group bacterium]